MSRGHWKQNSAKSSADSERHFRRRLAERYGLTISSDEYRALCKSFVRHGKPIFKESLTRTHWLIDVRGVSVRVVYDKTTKALATALPPLASAIETQRATTAGRGPQDESAVPEADAPKVSQ